MHYCKNKEEFIYLIKHLIKKEFIENQTNVDINENLAHIAIAPAGVKHVQGLQLDKKHLNKCFVAMCFDPYLLSSSLYTDAIEPAVKEAGYNPIKIDKVHHVDDINDKIISEIKFSRFLIADLTVNRGGVYFEAGFAFGLGIPVIYTCREDRFHKIHFDLRNRNTLKWSCDKLPEFKEKLIDRITAVVV